MSKFCTDIPCVDKLRPDLVAAAQATQPVLRDGITLRAIQPGDLDAIVSVLNNEEEKSWTRDEAKKLTAASIDPQATGGGWLAFADGSPAGIITTKEGFNGSVVTHKDFLRRGIGVALVTAREAHQWAQGQTVAQAHIESTNLKSIGLHKKMGYVHQSGEDKLLPNGAMVETYSKPLSAPPIVAPPKRIAPSAPRP